MLKASDIELIRTKFLRRILGMKTSTNLTPLYGELGRIYSHDQILDHLWRNLLHQ